MAKDPVRSGHKNLWKILSAVNSMSTNTLELTKFNQEGYIPVFPNETLLESFSQQHLSFGVKIPDHFHTVQSIMSRIFTEKILNFIVSLANKRLEIRRRDCFANKIFLCSPVVAADVLYAIAITFLCEHSSSLNLPKIRLQFQAVKAKFSHFPYGIDRYSEILQALTPTPDEVLQISQIFNESFFSVWDSVKLVHLCVDESICEKMT